jgi:hypothetical protein
MFLSFCYEQYSARTGTVLIRDRLKRSLFLIGEVDFWIFWIFNFFQFAIDGKNNSKTKVEKVFFFIFMSSYAEMNFKNKKKITK